MDLVGGLLLISSLSCTLVTGVIFIYAVIIMNGLANLCDREFIRAFQATDGIILDGHSFHARLGRVDPVRFGTMLTLCSQMPEI